jgi:hypothetical protein
VTIATQGEIALVSEPAVPAAKLHVLGLLPIKNKLGEKWPRLSGLVHSLFEKAISNAQGPSDHFIILDELSYVVSFHHLSMEEAGLACASIAQEVCKLLFGADVEDISVRSLVGLVSPQLFEAGSAAAAKISELLEQSGGEIVVHLWRRGLRKILPAPEWKDGRRANGFPERINWPHRRDENVVFSRCGICPNATASLFTRRSGQARRPKTWSRSVVRWSIGTNHKLLRWRPPCYSRRPTMPVASMPPIKFAR